MKDLVTIVIPCYMQAQYLQEAIDSVRAQTYPHWECIIVNDASPDHTATVADAAAATDSRIRVIHKPQNEGLAAARNSGIHAGTGTYIVPLDADDKLAPTFLDECLSAIAQHPGAKMIYTDAQHFGINNDYATRNEVDMHRLCHHNFCQPTALFATSTFLQTEGYRQGIYGYEDWDMWLQIIDHPSDAVCVHKGLFYQRIKEQSMITELLADEKKEQQVRKNLYRYNRKKIQHYAPELAIWHEQQLDNPDKMFLLKNKLLRLKSKLGI